MDNKNNTNLKIIYRYNIKSIIGIVCLLLLALTIIPTIIRNINASHNKFYDSTTNGIITPGFDQSSLIINIIFLIILIICIIIALKNLKLSYYEIICPYCGKVTYIRTNVEGADCEVCGQRFVMNNGQPETVYQIKEE